MLKSESIYRVDAPAKVTGDALYAGDITPDNLLHGKVLFSNQPHARMISMDMYGGRSRSGRGGYLHRQGCAGERIRPDFARPASADWAGQQQSPCQRQPLGRGSGSRDCG
jgi:CO/xanthine dehydrogenase Mo-binding subunit